MQQRRVETRSRKEHSAAGKGLISHKGQSVGGSSADVVARLLVPPPPSQTVYPAGTCSAIIDECRTAAMSNQHESAVVARRVPKKRKFDPAEYEQSADRTSPRHYNHSSQVPAAAAGPSSVISSSVVVATIPAALTTASSPPVLPRVATPPAAHVDLNEWRCHRVLAKTGSRYLTGVIRSGHGHSDVLVQLDGHEQPTLYSDVTRAGKFDVVSDASPSPSQLTLGARVCLRVDDHPQLAVFVEGVICQISSKPIQYLVRTIGQNPDVERWITRPSLRLLQPPWWEELENGPEPPSAPVLPPATETYLPDPPPATPSANAPGVKESERPATVYPDSEWKVMSSRFRSSSLSPP